MLKVILISVLAIMGGNASADEWVQVTRTKNNTVLVDPATITKVGNRVKMWALYNYHVEQTKDSGETFLSFKTHDEYHCTREQSRLLYIAQFSKQDGRGRRIYFHSYADESDWSPVDQGTAQEALWKFACEASISQPKIESPPIDWVHPIKVGTTTYYANPASIGRQDDRATMWYLEDYSQPLILARSLPNESNEAWSLKLHAEYDCVDMRRRNLAGIHFSENMGGGRILWSRDNPLNWENFVSGSVAHSFWKVACGRQ